MYMLFIFCEINRNFNYNNDKSKTNVFFFIFKVYIVLPLCPKTYPIFKSINSQGAENNNFY